MINFVFIIYVILIYVILGISTTFSRFHSLEPFLCDTGIPSAVIAVLVKASGWSSGPVLQLLYHFACVFHFFTSDERTASMVSFLQPIIIIP